MKEKDDNDDKNKKGNNGKSGKVPELTIYEGHPGIYDQPCEMLIPLKAQLVHNTKSFEFTKFFDPVTKKWYLGIKVTSYHSGEVILSMDYLKKIMQEDKNSNDNPVQDT